MPTWTILGAGAIGGLFACQLSRAGIPVQLITSRSGSGQQTLHLREQESETAFRFTLPDPASSIRHLIVTTKTWQTRGAMAAIRGQLDDHSIIIVMQNGMGTSEWLQAELPEARVLAATTTHGAYRENRNTIIHAGFGDTWLGPLRGKDEPAAREIYDRWQQQGLPVTWDGDIERRLWLKLGINCAINPLTVIHSCRNGELLQKPEALIQMEAIAAEFTAIYSALFNTEPDNDTFATAKAVAEKTGTNISSMRQDVLNGNPTEIDAINGYLVKRGRELGVTCPVNEEIIASLADCVARNQ